MLKTVFNKLLLLIYFVAGALILEAVTFNVLNLGAAPIYYWLNLSIIFIIALLVYVIPNFTAQYIVYTIILFVQAVFIYVNFSLHNIYSGDLFSFDMLRLISEAREAITADFIYLPLILQLTAVFSCIAIVGAIFLHICKKDKVKLKQHYSIFSIIILIGVQCFVCGYYFHQRNYINDLTTYSDLEYVNSDKFLMNTSFLKTSSYKKFGTYGYFLNLIINSLFDFDSNALKTATLDYFNNGSIYDNSDVFGVDKNNNVIVIMMESLEWFAFGDGNYDNEFNNLSNELTPNIYNLIYGSSPTEEDDSLIMKNFYAKSKTNYSEGIGIIGNYPVGQNLIDIIKKDKNKQQNVLGYSAPNILKTQGYTTTYLHSNDLDYYDRSSTHEYIGFDDAIGKGQILDADGNSIYTDLDFNHWAPEEEIVTYTINNIVPKNYQEKPFYSFYLNVSSHGPYEEQYNTKDEDYLRYKDYVIYGKENCKIVKMEDGQPFTDEEGHELTTLEEISAKFEMPKYIYKCKDEDAQYSSWYQNVVNRFETKDPALIKEVVYYEAGVVGMDAAIGVIVNHLKNNKMRDGSSLFDHTTMLLYADHYAHYKSVHGPLSNRFKGFDNNDSFSAELNTIPFIISSPGLKKKNAEALNNSQQAEYLQNYRFCSAYDIVPTLFDLLGVKFNENFYMGHSLFKALDYAYQSHLNTDMVIYYSNTGGLFGEYLYTDNLIDFHTYDNSPVNEQDVKYFKAEASVILTKLNYLHILNNQMLYNQIQN